MSLSNPLRWVVAYLLAILLYAFAYQGLSQAFLFPLIDQEPTFIAREKKIESILTKKFNALSGLDKSESVKVYLLDDSSDDHLTYAINVIDRRERTSHSDPNRLMSMEIEDSLRMRLRIDDEMQIRITPSVNPAGFTARQGQELTDLFARLFNGAKVANRWGTYVLPTTETEADTVMAYMLSTDGRIGSRYDFPRMLYFSMVTITTLGYGDIVPITTSSRLLAASESVIGVIIIGLFLNDVANKIRG